jgi:hypothetical protein
LTRQVKEIAIDKDNLAVRKVSVGGRHLVLEHVIGLLNPDRIHFTACLWHRT